jgi:DNA-binding PadR family transcriptional regulator
MAKLYSLTAAGRKAFAEEVTRWQRFTGAVSLVLES